MNEWTEKTPDNEWPDGEFEFQVRVDCMWKWTTAAKGRYDFGYRVRWREVKKALTLDDLEREYYENNFKQLFEKESTVRWSFRAGFSAGRNPANDDVVVEDE